MLEKTKIIIADDEMYICGMLEKIIDFEKLNLKLVGTAYDGEQLFSLIESQNPDIVITDICMPKMDGLEVIKKSKEKGYSCKFIVNSGYRHFDYAYNALKYEVEDYILKPVDIKELNAAIRKICDSLSFINKNDIAGTGSENVKKYFLTKAIGSRLLRVPKTIEEINNDFMTHFSAGYYRMILIKLDYDRHINQENEDASSVIRKIENLVSNQYEDLCFEFISEEKRDSILTLLNYSKETDTKIKDRLLPLFSDIQNVIELFRGLQVTLCVSDITDDLCKVEELKDQYRLCEWVRMTYGNNKMILAEKLRSDNGIFALNKLDELEYKLKIAFETVDIESFKVCINKFFSFPTTSLCQMKSMLFMRNIKEMFFKINEELLSEYLDTDLLWTNLNIALHQSQSFHQYKETLLSQLSDIMKQIKDFIQKKDSKPIRQTYSYIEQHFAEPITLEVLANEVNLSSVYFCSFFKKETGKNVTEYISEYRMKMARNMLANSDMNVNEIACAVGLNDARYFSKLFKKIVGIKPTEYRKIYG